MHEVHKDGSRGRRDWRINILIWVMQATALLLYGMAKTNTNALRALGHNMAVVADGIDKYRERKHD